MAFEYNKLILKHFEKKVQLEDLAGWCRNSFFGYSESGFFF